MCVNNDVIIKISCCPNDVTVSIGSTQPTNINERKKNSQNEKVKKRLKKCIVRCTPIGEKRKERESLVSNFKNQIFIERSTHTFSTFFKIVEMSYLQDII